MPMNIAKISPALQSFKDHIHKYGIFSLKHSTLLWRKTFGKNSVNREPFRKVTVKQLGAAPGSAHVRQTSIV
jgi:hypothetical protein